MVALTQPAVVWRVAGPLLLRIAARRPSSWLAAGMACGAAWAPQPLGAVAVASLALLAATGDLPPSGMPPSLGGWIIARMALPLAGLAGGVAIRLITAPLAATTTIPIARAAGVAVLLTAVTVWAVRRRSEVATADAVSLAMLTATAAALGGLAAGSLLVAVVSWAAMAAVASWLVHWLGRRTAGPLPRGGGDLVAGLMFPTPLRRVLGRLAMAAMLAAMVGWVLLNPARAGWAAALAAALMICLALPLVVFQNGSGEDAVSPWAALLRSAPGRRFGLSEKPPALAVETVVRHAAVLGWPSLVAAAVAAGSPVGPWPAILVVAVIAATGGAILGVGLVCRGLGLSRETTFATALALMAGMVLLLPVALGDDVAASRPNLPDFSSCGDAPRAST
ncbi:MAG: hypothetical protein O3A37_00850 [Planctomycetota bacterium]|nr:hypothetical protein [Planctomycetota bacterium]